MTKNTKSTRRKTESKKINKKNKNTVFKYTKLIWLTAILIVVILVITLSSLFFTFHKTPKKIVIQTKPTFSEQYIADFTKKDWKDLWNLYSPDYQNFINSEVGKSAYLAFLQKKFANIQIKYISIDSCKTKKTIYPYGVEKNYPNTCLMNLTLSLSSQNATIAAQLPIFDTSNIVITKTKNKTFIVGGGPTDLQAPVLFPATIPNFVTSVPVLMYHRIAPMPLRTDFQTEYGYLIDVGLTITPYNFAAQMDQLQSLGYHTITPNDLFNHLYYNLPLPPKPVLLTFDDGRLSDFTYGLPILVSHNFTATFMIPPFLMGKMFGYHNHNKYMSLNDLQTLTRDGMFVENHSLYHAAPLWGIPPQKLHDQLTTASNEIFSYTQYPIQFIAYPGKWPYANWQQASSSQKITMKVLSNMGFAFSFLDLGQNKILENSFFPYQIPRIRPENLPAITFLL